MIRLVYPFFHNEKDRWTWRDLVAEGLRTVRVVVAAYLVVILVVRPAAVLPLEDVLHRVVRLLDVSRPSESFCSTLDCPLGGPPLVGYRPTAP